MKKIYLISVGKLKEENILSLEKDFLKRIKNFYLSIHEVKSSNDNTDLEGAFVQKKIDSLKKSNFKIILLSEWGQQRTSQQFSTQIYKDLESFDHIFFIIGGASGHGKNILDLPHEKLSMGKMTYPHKLARLLLIEQLYRAEAIHNNHPYHK